MIILSSEETYEFAAILNKLTRTIGTEVAIRRIRQEVESRMKLVLRGVLPAHRLHR